MPTPDETRRALEQAAQQLTEAVNERPVLAGERRALLKNREAIQAAQDTSSTMKNSGEAEKIVNQLNDGTGD